MPAFILVRAIVHQPDAFARYVAAVTPLVAAFGGRYRVLAGETEIFEGEWPAGKWVMHEWPSAEAARSFWQSPDYGEVKKLREGTGEFSVLLLDGVAAQTLE